MNWLQNLLPKSIRIAGQKEKRGVPEGLWTKCTSCNAVLYRADLDRNLYVCPKCSHHEQIGARQRLEYFLDKESWQEIGAEILPQDYLKFKDTKRYKDRLAAGQKKTGETDGLVVYEGLLNNVIVVAAAFDFGFLGGSMGTVVGERFVKAIERSLEKRAPLICFSASGGARMQEGMFSLMQMAKTSAALAKLAKKNIPFISVLADPTMGGVSASLAMLGDIIIAEPKARIGFAGAKVIEQTVRETLPEGFQRSEFLLEHGAIDQIIERREHRERISKIIAMLTKRAVPESQMKLEEQVGD